MGCSLVVNPGVGDLRHAFVLQWIVDGDEGGVLGDSGKAPGPEPKGREEWETWLAVKTASESKTAEHAPYHGFSWENEKDARAVLRQIKEAWKHRERPMPEWAKTALAAGWKPPKGWKP